MEDRGTTVRLGNQGRDDCRNDSAIGLDAVREWLRRETELAWQDQSRILDELEHRVKRRRFQPSERRVGAELGPGGGR